jgi:hypothetical protein
VNVAADAHTLIASTSVDEDVVGETRHGLPGNGTATFTVNAPGTGNVRFELATTATDGPAGVTLAVASCNALVLHAAVAEGAPRFTNTVCE